MGYAYGGVTHRTSAGPFGTGMGGLGSPGPPQPRSLSLSCNGTDLLVMSRQIPNLSPNERLRGHAHY